MASKSRRIVDLFVGQLIALAPVGDVGTPAGADLFPRNVDPEVSTKKRTPRPKTYSVITDGTGRGTMTVRHVEIEVDILPLDLKTPKTATVFRVVAVAGRAISVTGVVEEPPAVRPAR